MVFIPVHCWQNIKPIPKNNGANIHFLNSNFLSLSLFCKTFLISKISLSASMPGSILLKTFLASSSFPFEISHLGVSDIKNIPIPKINAGNTPNKSINLHPN